MSHGLYNEEIIIIGGGVYAIPGLYSGVKKFLPREELIKEYNPNPPKNPCKETLLMDSTYDIHLK